MNFQLLPHRLSPRLLDPIVRTMAAAGLTPNMVSALGLLGTIAAAALAARGSLASAGIVLLLAAALDFLDGGLARATGRATKFGGVLDSTLDRVSEAVILFGVQWYAIAQGLHEESRLAFVAAIASLMVSYIRARVEASGGQLTDGIFTRPERVVVLVLALVTGYLRVGLWILAIVSTITAVQRLWLAQAAVADQPPAPRRPRSTRLAPGKE